MCGGDIATLVMECYIFKMVTDMVSYRYIIELPSEIHVDLMSVIIFTFLYVVCRLQLILRRYVVYPKMNGVVWAS